MIYYYLVFSGILISTIGMMISIELSLFLALCTVLYAVLVPRHIKQELEFNTVHHEDCRLFIEEIRHLRHKLTIGDLTPAQYQGELEEVFIRYRI